MNSNFLKLPVTSVMSSDITFVNPDTIMDEVSDIFSGKNIHHLPVINDEGEIVGIVSKSDYYKLLNSYTIFNRKDIDAMNERYLKSLIVEDVMTENPVCIHWDSKVETVIQVFLENLFHALPVVKDKKLVGIITPYDILSNLVANPQLID